MTSTKKICSEPDCFKTVSLATVGGDVVYKPDGSIYERSLKCWDCRTETDRKAIKRARNKYNRLVTNTH